MKNTRKSLVDWESDIYAKGLQLNDWPYTDVVSDILKLTSGQKRSKLKILEIGCGACNNLWFAAEAGFNISGIDISTTAVDYGKARLSRLGFKDVDLKVGDITTLDWEDDYFDIVLDRGALTQNNYFRINQCAKEIHRVLKINGTFLSYTLFGFNCSDLKYGKEMSKNTFDYFSDGFFSKVGLTSFFDQKEILNLFKNFKEIQISRRLDENLTTQYVMECYSLSCKK